MRSTRSIIASALLAALLCSQYAHGSALAAVPHGKPAASSRPSRSNRSLQEQAADPNQTCTKPLAPVQNQPYCVVPSTVSPQAQTFLRGRGVVPAPDPITNEAAVAMREVFNSRVGQASADAARSYLQSVHNSTIAGVPVSVGTPRGAQPANRKKMIMFLHGGAYVYGSCYHYWQTSALVAMKAGIAITCVEYRLAPQNPYPAGLNDALAVYKTLIKQYKPKNIVIMGDSAGGGLSLALTLKLKAEKLPIPGALVLISPWSDLGKTGDTMTTLAGVDPLLQYELNLKPAALAYAGGNRSQIQDPFISPLRASFAAPWPHTYIQVGTRDSFLSACIMLHRKLKPLRAVGIDIEFSPWEGMWHVFNAVLDTPEAIEADAEMASFITKHLQSH